MSDAPTYAPVPQPPAQNELLVALGDLLRATFEHYSTAHALHWNVLGYQFVEAHGFLGDIYKAVWGRIDDIAEWVRRLDGQAPVVFGDFVATPAPVVEYCEGVTVLLGQTEDYIARLRPAINMANASGEAALSNFLADLLDESQKRRWMYRSILTAVGDEAEEDGAPEGAVVLEEPEGLTVPAPGMTVQEVEPAEPTVAPMRSLEVDCEYRRTDDGVETPRTERRASDGVELRSAPNGKLVLDGYATVYGYPYPIAGGPDAGGFTEKIARGAATKSIKDGADVVLLVDHQGAPLARTKSGTLQLTSDEIGLRVRAELDPENPRVAELRSAMARGDQDAMSFAFRVTRDAWRSKDGGPGFDVREISEVALHDVSIVTHPANPSTVAVLAEADPAPMRSLDLAREQVAALRDA